MPSEAPVTSAHVLEGWPNVRSWDCYLSLIEHEFAGDREVYRFARKDEQAEHQSCEL